MATAGNSPTRSRFVAEVDRFLDRADEIHQQVHVLQGVADLDPQVAPRRDHEYVAACQGLRIRRARFVIELGGRHALKLVGDRAGDFERERRQAGGIAAIDDEAHRPGGLLDEAIDQ